MQLLTTLRSDLTAALKARDTVKVSVIRALLSSIANAEAVPLPTGSNAVGIYAGDAARRSVETEEVKRLLEEEVAERTGAASVYTDPAEIERMQREAGLIREYLISL